MDDRFLQRLSGRISRKEAITRIGAMGLGLVGGVFGRSAPGAQAACSYYPTACCCTYLPSSSGCITSGCACVWSWSCNFSGTWWNCVECYSSTSGGCTGYGGLKCSQAYAVGSR